MKLRVLAISIVLLAGIPQSLRADENLRAGDCEGLFAEVGAVDSPTFRPWSFAGTLDLSPEQILPAAFLKKLSTAFGIPAKLDVYNLSFQKRIKISISDRSIVTINLNRDPRDSTSVYVDNLTLENPLGDEKHLHLSQDHKGLPVAVSSHIRDQILELLRAAGFKTVHASSAQNYVVSLLYRRWVGMRPASSEGEKMYRYFDELFLKSRQLLPETERPRSLNDFALFFGDAGQRVADYQSQLTAADIARGIVPEGIQLIRDNSDSVIGFIDLSATPEDEVSKVLFFKPGTFEILQWSEFARSPEAQLVRDL